MSVAMIAAAVISIGISLAAAYYLRPKGNKSFVRDDKPTTLAERGAFVPWVLGRRRLGSIICWAGDRSIRKESIGSGGKGSKKKKQYQHVYHESAMHVLCIGPAFKLHRIWVDGGVLFQGTIDAQSHPSGTTVDLGNEGSFQIYWGEHNQPANAFLGDPSRIGIESQWPFYCYVVWRDKRLGTTPRWPLIDYEIEVRIMDTAFVAAGAPWMEAARTLSGSPQTIHEVTNGVPGTNFLRLAGNQSKDFPAGGQCRIAGNEASANGDYRIHKSVFVPPNTWVFGVYLGGNYTDVYLDHTLVGATVSGTLQPFTVGTDDGINPAHAVAHLFFSKFPHGAELDPAEFDLSTLDDLAQVCEDEKIPVSVLAQDGQEAIGTLATLMQDVGFMVGLDTIRGKYVFRAIRQEDPSKVVAIDQDVLLSPNPEVTVPIGERAADKLVFVFQDRSRNFRDMTITLGDDGLERALKRQKTRKVDIPSAISYEVATRIGNRRMLEELSGGAILRFPMNRASRYLVPGTAFTVPGYPGTYRVKGIELDTLSGRVSVEALVDIFGSKKSDFESPALPPVEDPAAVELDLAADFLEVPSLASPREQRLIVPRIRAHSQVLGADIWLSRDGSTYQHAAADDSTYTGGTLVSEFSSQTDTLLAQGPIIQVLGPDIATVEDLSGDPATWRAGKQLCAIGSEVFFLSKVTSLGGGQYRLDGLLRARFEGKKFTHPAGTAVFIFQDDVLQIEDPLLEPLQPLHVKIQPRTDRASFPLSQVPVLNKTLVGKGLAPPPMANPRAGGPSSPHSNSYRSGEAVTLSWTHRSMKTPRAGAGMVVAGSPVGASEVDGSFTLTLKDGGGNVVHTVVTTDTAVTITNGNLQAFFGGAEPAQFTAEVVNVLDGLSTDPLVITVKKAA